MQKIAILGCGWLGFPLAKSLLLKKYSINGSSTSESKLSVLKENGIAAFQIRLNENSIDGDVALFLKDSAVLIIDIPPKLRSDSSENFVLKISALIPFIERASIKKVIFVSSTSVYADDNSNITEETSTNADSESGKQLVITEKLLQSNSNFKTTVIRFGGLVGEDRHPIHFLAGKKNINNPNSPINLIHLDDCIGIIETIIEKESWNEIFNAVHPIHPSRKEYYTKIAIDLLLPLPEFDDSKPSYGKTILSDKIIKTLDYNFKKSLYEL